MNVLLIGTLVPEATSNFCYKKGVKVSAADIAQKYILHGLESIKEVNSADVIGAVRVSSWPKSRVFRFKRDEQNTEKGKVKSCPYINAPFLGFWFREFSLINSAKKWAKEHKNDKDVVVFVYAMTSSGMKAARAVKKIIPTAKITLITADLPLFMNMKGKLRRIAKKTDWLQIKSLMKWIDKYLLYTKHMAEYLKLDKDKWMVFEGLIDESRIVTEPQKKEGEKKCLYAGNLDARYGIDMLIEAFKDVKSGATLDIYGAGADKERISDLVKDMSNVEYKGQVTQEEIFEIMKISNLLINPRPSTIGLAKYSCPSKTFEYMASGTPVLMNKLSGIPDEYDPHLLFFKSETAKGYAETIDEVLTEKETDIQKIGIDAAKFIKKKKNSLVVMQNVLKFVFE